MHEECKIEEEFETQEQVVFETQEEVEELSPSTTRSVLLLQIDFSLFKTWL